MSKRIPTALVTAALTVIMCMTAFAGEWKIEGNGRWYDNGDGTYPYRQIVWIDDDGDGIAECYGFDQNGYVYEGPNTYANFTVNEYGQWTLNGVVQQRSTSNPADNGSNNCLGTNVSVAGRYYMEGVPHLIFDVEVVDDNHIALFDDNLGKSEWAAQARDVPQIYEKVSEGIYRRDIIYSDNYDEHYFRYFPDENTMYLYDFATLDWMDTGYKENDFTYIRE